MTRSTQQTTVRVSSVLLCLGVVSCASHRSPSPSPAHEIGALWRAPVDLEQRDLLYGRGRLEWAPQPDAQYEFVAEKHTGTQPGYDVRDGSGNEWSVKLGEEARPEVTASRLLWAIGYHQPVVYYVPAWTL